jgi:hypothetical protein
MEKGLGKSGKYDVGSKSLRLREPQPPFKVKSTMYEMGSKW